MDTSVAGDPFGHSYSTARAAALVVGTSGLAAVLPSSIARAPHNIPGMCTSAGEFASFIVAV